jgi:hypothetical protein
MGASQSYGKVTESDDDLNSNINKLIDYLDAEGGGDEEEESADGTQPEQEICNSTIPNSWCHDDKLSRHSIEKLNELSSNGVLSPENIDISTNLEKIKASMDMYLLYDNYNLKNNVIIKDLKKKLQNQNAEVKTDDEQIDKLKFNINNLKENIETNKSIKLYLLIVIILALLLIIIFSVLLYFKYKV